MEVTGKNNVGSYEPNVAPKEENKGLGLGEDAFLKLFMEGLKNQDPLNPMDSGQMMQQMAQLGFMEQVTKMSKSIEGLEKNILSNKWQQGASLMGKNAEAMLTTGELVSGKIDSVRMEDEVIKLLIQGEEVHVGQLRQLK